jgi:hypothetical protein
MWVRGGEVGARCGLGLSLVLLACSSGGSAPPEATAGMGEQGPIAPDPVADPPPAQPEGLYDPEHLLEVSIELAASDWEALRADGRSLFDFFLGRNTELEYTEFDAVATVDGQRYEGVTVRKKGALGSMARLRPSLKLDFGDGPRDPALPDLSRLTLNNNRQDPSHAKQCLVYGLFAKAGLPAPRCNLAHVVVNGEDLGTFSNVEAIKKPFLRRYFANDSGNLYEAQGVDFIATDTSRFELKTNEAANDRGDLERLITALDAPDAELVTRLSEVLDLEQFRDFWALETLTGHWDGYAGNRNNYFAYADPESGLFHFMPWGTDGTFVESSPVDALNSTRTVYARSRIANRLYNLVEQRQLFRDRLGELSESVWDEGVLVAELEQLTALAPDAWPAATDALTQHLETHRVTLTGELALPAPEWIATPSTPSPCNGIINNVSMEFSTDYGDLDAAQPGAGEFEVALSLDGNAITSSWFGRAGVDPAATEPNAIVRALTFLPDGRGIFLQVTVPRSQFAPGVRPLWGLESAGLVVVLDGANSRFIGFISDGSFELDQASLVAGAPVSGRLNARLLQLGCADL